MSVGESARDRGRLGGHKSERPAHDVAILCDAFLPISNRFMSCSRSSDGQYSPKKSGERERALQKRDRFEIGAY